MLENIRLAFQGIWSHKLRSILTMLGIIIGIAAIITIVSPIKGTNDQIKENLKKIRESGVLVGLGTHRPDVIELAEEEGWDVDFYMACLQTARLSRKGVPGSYITGPTKQDLLFFPEDRAIMLDLISRVSKPCIAFKIFAGGQVFHGKPESETPNIIKEVYREVFSKLKPCDVAAIGVYQGRKNQIAENVRLFEEAMR